MPIAYHLGEEQHGRKRLPNNYMTPCGILIIVVFKLFQWLLHILKMQQCSRYI
ncbi:unnamed protein product [Ilex paraguariensis]|uniref:Uncharacterized protein n=1 Tax=Ilex paraguariensis TaxID=185542 RepID=A0ABC8U684_9AQUA